MKYERSTFSCRLTHILRRDRPSDGSVCGEARNTRRGLISASKSLSLSLLSQRRVEVEEESNEKTNRRRTAVAAAGRKMSRSWKNKFCFHCFYGRLAAIIRQKERERGRRDKERKLHFVVFCVMPAPPPPPSSFSLLPLVLFVPHEPLPVLVPSDSSSPSRQQHFKGLHSLVLSVSRRIALQRRKIQFLTNLLSVLRHPIMNLSSPLMY